MEKRSSFTGKLGFILAAAGSAVGLGNIWRFPYLAAKYGGGIFLLVYIILSVTFGFALMVGEIALGRKTGLSAIGAFKKISKKYAFIGWIISAIPMIILPYYSVIGGWVTKYLFTFVTGSGVESSVDGYFEGFVAKTGEPIFWFAVFIAITVLIVLFGVVKGIERVSKIMMPVLAVLSVFIAVYTMLIPGAWEGVIYYIKPDFSNLSVMTVVSAMGQLFYSMSLAMGIMITYGSYMKKNVNIERSVHSIEIFDTGIAFFAGLMIIPAVFAFSGGNEEALGKGPGLMFITLPKVFESMAGGQIIGTLFFLLVFFAALTSSVSLTETVISILQDKLKIDRKILCLIVLVGCIIIGIPSSLGFGVWDSVRIFGLQLMDFFDFISNSIMMPLGAFLTCIFIGYVVKPSFVIEEVELNGRFGMKKLFCAMIKYIAPVFLVVILISSILDVTGVLKI
ncbi:MAG: sodium-dependent transporter [Clostridia bacterium]|nr:sodium-dependent transporter [Clostridia bacterium]